VDPRAGLDAVEKRKFLILPRLELRPLGRPARSQSLHRRRYLWLKVVSKLTGGLDFDGTESSGSISREMDSDEESRVGRMQIFFPVCACMSKALLFLQGSVV
jgi:hypothetical protein